jgi:hypothetical protein
VEASGVKTFSAPWSVLLKAISAAATLLCLGLLYSRFVWPGPMPLPVLLFSVLTPVLLIIICALFTVRGYVVTPDAIFVQRLIWNTRLPREGLESAEFAPEATRGSIRTCGNGGLYSFTGWYRNRTLGNYRAFVTDQARIVVLRYPGKTIVVSPGDPEEFVREVMPAA